MKSCARNGRVGRTWASNGGCVGSGDAFAAGLIYGLLNEKEIEFSLNCGLANSALTLTTLGDGSAAMLAEVENLAQSDNLSLFR